MADIYQNTTLLEQALAKANALPDKPAGTAQITTNGTHNIAEYDKAEVNVPTGTQRTASDVTVSGATVSVPAGLYGNAVSKSVAAGSAGTPTATKGSVSNHSVTVTPKVTNTTGYITGGTKTGSGVTVSASELVSGSETKTENGTYDVTNLASVVVNVQGGGGTLIEKSITQNGTYNASDDDADGYSKVTVAVSGGGGATVTEEENEFGGITMTITE